jgi:hypothetical protein
MRATKTLRRRAYRHLRGDGRECPGHAADERSVSMSSRTFDDRQDNFGVGPGLGRGDRRVDASQVVRLNHRIHAHHRRPHPRRRRPPTTINNPRIDDTIFKIDRRLRHPLDDVLR